MNLARIVIVVALAASSAHAADIAGEPVAPAHPCGHGEAWTCTVQCDPGMRTIPQALGAAMPGAQICAISSCACVAIIHMRADARPGFEVQDTGAELIVVTWGIDRLLGNYDKPPHGVPR